MSMLIVALFRTAVAMADEAGVTGAQCRED
jgi:hypothetical protein